MDNHEFSMKNTSLLRRFYAVHWSACMFYFIARQCGFSKRTWIGADTKLLQESNVWERCACLSVCLSASCAWRLRKVSDAFRI
jgi:hypothetical protein